MQVDPLLQELAQLLGRALARRWLRQREHDQTTPKVPNRDERELVEKDAGAVDAEPSNDGARESDKPD